MGIFLEGIESLKLACSLVLLIPALGITLLGRRRVWLVTAWVVTVSLIAWLRFTLWFTPWPSGTLHVLAGIALVAIAAIAWRRDELAYDLGATVSVAFIAGWTWMPCVGSELADVTNNAPKAPWSNLVPTALYMAGLFVPLILIAALDVAWPKFAEVTTTRRVRSTGLAVVALVGALVAVTLFDDLASELARRSSF